MQRFKSSGSARSFSPHTPPSKTASTSNAISHPAARSASSDSNPDAVRCHRALSPDWDLQLTHN
jgi:hypothetical protein